MDGTGDPTHRRQRFGATGAEKKYVGSSRGSSILGSKFQGGFSSRTRADLC